MEINELEERLRRARTSRGKVDAMTALAARLFPDEVVRALAINSDAVALAEKIDYRHGLALSLRQEAMCLSMMGQGEMSIATFDRSRQLFIAEGDHAQATLAIAYAADAHNRRGEFSIALQRAAEARHLGNESGDRSALSTALHVTGVTYVNLGRHQDALPYFTQALALRREVGDQIPILGTLNALCIVHRQQGEFAVAINIGQETIEIARRLGERRFLCGCLTNMGTIYTDLGDYPRALENFFEAASIASEVGIPHSHAIALQNIADVHRSLRELDLALGYYHRALAIHTESGNQHLRARCMGSMGNVYGELGDREREMEYLTESHRIAVELDAGRDIVLSLEYLGHAYRRRGEHVVARDHFLQALDVARTIGANYMEVYCYRMAAELSMELGEFNAAIDQFTQALRISQQTGSSENLHDIHHHLARAYHRRGKRGDAASALEEYALSITLREESLGTEKQRAMAELEVRFEVERITREKEILAMKLDHKSKELAAMAIHLAEKNEIIEGVRRQVKQAMDALHGTSKPLLRSLLMDLERSGTSEHGWLEFEEQFQLVHGAFLATLADRYPSLTPTELKVCALLKLNLSTKEIAGFLRVTPRAIDKHRNSIRRKMGIAADVNLLTFLGGI